MPVSHAAEDEHFTATVQFLCLGALTYPASSKRILFIGLCCDGRVLEIRSIVWISYCTRCCLFISILFSCKCTQMTLWRGHCVRGSGLFFSGQPGLIEKMRLFSPVWRCGSFFSPLFCSAFVFFLSVSWHAIVDVWSLRFQHTFLRTRLCIWTCYEDSWVRRFHLRTNWSIIPASQSTTDMSII